MQHNQFNMSFIREPNLEACFTDKSSDFTSDFLAEFEERKNGPCGRVNWAKAIPTNTPAVRTNSVTVITYS